MIRNLSLALGLALSLSPAAAHDTYHTVPYYHYYHPQPVVPFYYSPNGQVPLAPRTPDPDYMHPRSNPPIGFGFE